MDKNETNRKIALWLGVLCWHEQDIWHCKKCNANLYEVEKATGQVNPDYYTHDGFFALLDGLKEKAATMRTEIDTNLHVYRVRIWSVAPIVLIGLGRSSELPTALVEATLQAMERSDG